jgi:hypothetical protein
MIKRLIPLLLVAAFAIPLLAANVPNEGNIVYNRAYDQLDTLTKNSGKWYAAQRKVGEIRIKIGGKFLVYTSRQRKWTPLYPNDYDIFRVEVDSIDMTGATADTILVQSWWKN